MLEILEKTCSNNEYDIEVQCYDWEISFKSCQAFEILLKDWYKKRYLNEFAPSNVLLSTNDTSINFIFVDVLSSNVDQHKIATEFQLYLDGFDYF